MVELIGIAGGGFYLFAFFETASGKWNGRSFWYEAFNLIGALLLGYYSIYKGAYSNIVLNLIWGIVALYGLHHILQRRQHRKAQKRSSRRKKT